MTEEQWARERATVIDAEPAFSGGREEKPLAKAAKLEKPKMISGALAGNWVVLGDDYQ